MTSLQASVIVRKDGGEGIAANHAMKVTMATVVEKNANAKITPIAILLVVDAIVLMGIEVHYVKRNVKMELMGTSARTNANVKTMLYAIMWMVVVNAQQD